MIAKQIIRVGKVGLYSSENGRFYTYNRASRSFGGGAGCREIFSGGFFSTTTHVGFYTQNSGSMENFNQFIEHVEKLLKLEKRVLIYKTDRAGFFIVQLTPFWTEASFRREIFTLLLRCGSIYHKKVEVMNNRRFFKSLNKYHLTQAINLPLKHFFAGNVNLKRDVPNGRLVLSFIKRYGPYQQENLKKAWKRMFKK